MGVELVEGRYFSPEYGSDLTHSVILNETAVEMLGIEDPVGKKYGNQTIIGVVKDFNLHSLHSDIPPMYISLTDRYIRQVAIRYKSGALEDLQTLIEAEWESRSPERPLNINIIEELVAQQYTAERNLSRILSFAALFTLLIAAFGLFGLTLFVARSRTNEIGIKKVFGSSERTIVRSFLRSNFIQVVIAGILSIPITVYFMNRWLQNFSYRTQIDWWVFLIAFLVALIVVMLTIFTHALKASRINPVEALRYE
jgi:putative ABC transport system permease protein